MSQRSVLTRRIRDRDAGRGHGAVHRQDRHADREPHDGDAPGGRRRRRWTRRAGAWTRWPPANCPRPSTRWSSSRSWPARPTRSTRWSRPSTGSAQRFLADTEHLHRDWRWCRLRADPGAARDVACLGSAGRRRARRRRQGRAGGDHRSVPPRRRAQARIAGAVDAHGRRRPARAGGGPGALRRARTGRRSSTTSSSSSSACWGWPTRCAPRAGGGGRVPRGRHPRGDDHRRLPRHRAGHARQAGLPRRDGDGADRRRDGAR